jgi:ADP-ribosylation factor-like protein 8
MYYVRKMLDWLKSKFWAKDLELSIIGLQNAGKTTLINSLKTDQYDPDTIPTVGVNTREFKKGNVTLKIWDLGGQRRYRESWEKYCATSDCIVFVLDSIDRDNVDIARTQLEKLLSWESLDEIPLLVLGNKNDLPGCYKEEEIIEVMGLKSIKDRKVGCYSISAKNMNNLDNVLKWLSQLNKIH